jgi:hypothetical protein
LFNKDGVCMLQMSRYKSVGRGSMLVHIRTHV